MNSPNIIHQPLNIQGALELGLCPCTYCYSGFSNYSQGICTTCYTSCEYIKLWNDKEKLELIRLRGK